MNPAEGTTILQKLPTITQCIFCWDKIEQDLHNKWYLTLDKSCCICEECFKDFKDLFQWKLLDGWDVEL